VKSYFLRRLLLIPPTLLGITLLVFAITRFVPGGPMERMLQQAAESQKGSKSSGNSQGGLSEEQMEELEEQFGLDKTTLIAYGQWLGAIPREVNISGGAARRWPHGSRHPIRRTNHLRRFRGDGKTDRRGKLEGSL
jgi:hypothetical protein